MIAARALAKHDGTTVPVGILRMVLSGAAVLGIGAAVFARRDA
jgi:hypothetical protein